jgi:hypothetical protein
MEVMEEEAAEQGKRGRCLVVDMLEERMCDNFICESGLVVDCTLFPDKLASHFTLFRQSWNIFHILKNTALFGTIQNIYFGSKQHIFWTIFPG